MKQSVSVYQKNIYEQVNSRTNLMINAVAGSGKTTTLIDFMKKSVGSGSSIFVAFNKNIATEIGTKVPESVECKTLHGFGFSAIRKAFGYVKADSRKLQFIMNKYPATSFLPGMSQLEKAGVYKIRKQITDLVSIWKNTLIDFENREDVAATAAYYGINYDTNNLGCAQSVMRKSIEMYSFIDFDDMIYFPVAHKLVFDSYDNVFIDECQDLNRAQIEMVLRIVKKPNGRIIAVGDPNQSIYGFRGADIKAMSRIKEALNAKEMPLSVCYRCPKSHIALAQEIVPNIEAAPDAVAGEIHQISKTDMVDNLQNDPLVLCRTNAPLISYALTAIKAGKKAHVRGADIGNYLKGLVIGFNAKNIVDLNQKLDEWETKELEKLTKRRASVSVKNTIMDYADVLREMITVCSTPNDIVNTISAIFSDKTDGILFSSVHRAKGLQAENVYIIKPDQLPLIWKNQKSWELDQEMNLKYVALSRATKSISFVNE